jgi:hypothetical protein
MNGGVLGSFQALAQIGFRKIIHQKTNRATVHAVDGNTGGYHFMHGLQHMAIATQGHDHVGFCDVGIAIEFGQTGIGAFGSRSFGSEEGDLFEGHAGLVTLTGGVSRYMEGHDVQNDFWI